MSLSLGPKDPDPALHTTVRKYFIMEKMGDKDIVRRAFKTFQSNFNQPKTSGEDRSLVKTQVVRVEKSIWTAVVYFDKWSYLPEEYHIDLKMFSYVFLGQVPSRGTMPKVSTSTSLQKENGR